METGNIGGYTYKYVTNDPMGTRFYTLKNGLTVILSPNKKEPSVSVKIAVRTGSNNDPGTIPGLPHILSICCSKAPINMVALIGQKKNLCSTDRQPV